MAERIENINKTYLDVSFGSKSYEPDFATYYCRQCNRDYYFTRGPKSDAPCEHLKELYKAQNGKEK